MDTDDPEEIPNSLEIAHKRGVMDHPKDSNAPTQILRITGKNDRKTISVTEFQSALEISR